MKLTNNNLFIEKCLVGNNWCNAYDNKVSEITNPATGKIIGTVPLMGKRETQEAISIAQKALIVWKEKSADERYIAMTKWHNLIMQNIHDLATILTTEQGKPLLEAYNEIQYAADFIIWFAEETKRINGMTLPSHIKNSKIIVNKEPVGVCAAITPWNFPAAMITRKVAPALAAGCTVVLKPAPETPFTALAMIQLALDADIDGGVINVITGDEKEIGYELSTNPIIRKLSFTGSTAIGKILMAQCAGTVKKMSLELGGNAPFIVCADADLDNAVTGAVASRYRNNGQTCICANRIFVHHSIYEEFSERLSSEVRKLKIGDGLDKGVTQGPLINIDSVNRIKLLIEDAKEKGANIILGGNSHDLGGCFFEPTIIQDVNNSMNCYKEEIFGPVCILIKFNTEDEIIQMANDTNFGLAAYIYSENKAQAWQMADQLEYGMVGINEVKISSTITPFGGIKESGFGREGSIIGIEEYLKTKCILIK